jgi:lantibiotic leader peptide-processing serine protease
MRFARSLGSAGIALLAGLTACQQDSPTDPTAAPPVALAKSKSPTYLISLGSTAPADLAARLERAGGRIKKVDREAGIASVESDAADFSTKVKAIPGVEGVGRDRVFQWVDPNLRVIEADHGSDETFFNVQWNTKAIHAAEAWHTGAIGTGVRVAVLDGGLNNNHQDLAGSVDVACSASMVAHFNFNQDAGTAASFSHATHVAGIVAAQDDGIGSIGVAPGATIMGVKVLQDGSGSFDDVINGILYAAKPSRTRGKAGCVRADIINMSLGALIDMADPENVKSEVEELLRALNKATSYANKQGVTIIAAAGNEAINHDKGHRFITVPAQSEHVISVSATGPVGYAVNYPNGATNFERPASYTNFGQSLVDLAAPGGDDVLPGDDLCSIPLNPAGAGTIDRLCFVFDLIRSPATLGNTDGYFFAAGTSMAAPHVAGIAALIIGKNRGRMNPDQVEAKLKESARDLGKRGNDKFYGDGFVDALRAVR